MRRFGWALLTAGIAVTAVTGGCSSPKCRERGWIGGDLRPVQACGAWYEATAPATRGETVIGMPANAGTPCGLLVHAVPCASPLARAGVRQGDLIVALDGRPVGTPLEFRKAVEARAPGTPATVDVWRRGSTVAVPAVVGRERYERKLRIGIGIPIDPHVDLDPFDDGIDVFGLVVARSYTARHDLATVEREYLADAVPGKEVRHPSQERVDVGVFPLYVGTETRVLAQESVPPVR